MKIDGENLFVVTATKIMHFVFAQNIPVLNNEINSAEEFSQF